MHNKIEYMTIAKRRARCWLLTNFFTCVSALAVNVRSIKFSSAINDCNAVDISVMKGRNKPENRAHGEFFNKLNSVASKAA